MLSVDWETQIAGPSVGCPPPSPVVGGTNIQHARPFSSSTPIKSPLAWRTADTGRLLSTPTGGGTRFVGSPPPLALLPPAAPRSQVDRRRQLRTQPFADTQVWPPITALHSPPVCFTSAQTQTDLTHISLMCRCVEHRAYGLASVCVHSSIDQQCLPMLACIIMLSSSVY
jgi:hypothetical protein